jgi:Ca2+-binding RTX toxin-like protein
MGRRDLVNTNVAGAQNFPSVVGLPDGGYVISWEDLDSTGGDGSGSRVKFQGFDAAGSKIGGEVIANVDPSGDQNIPRMTATDNGFVIVWTDTTDIEYRRFDTNGIALDSDDGPPLILPGTQLNLAPAPLGSGFAIAYQDNSTGTQDIRVQPFLANGQPTGVISVAGSADDETDPAIAELADGRFVVAWQNSTTERIQVRGFNAGGAEAFAAVNVSGVADTQVSQASITALDNGAFVVAWTNGNPIFPDTDGSSSVRARIVTSNGTLIGSEFTINTLTDGNQTNLCFAALPDGGFVAVYQSNEHIRGQVFDAYGAREGDEFLVNTSTDAHQSSPSVAALADGRFVVTWFDDSTSHPDDPASAVRQQIFDPRDGVVTGTLNADTLFGHDLVNDEINGLGGADILNGLAGADIMYGGEDSDTYVVDNPGDRGIELVGQGTDTILSSVSFALGANVENLTLTGAGRINAAGNALANILTGNAAANILTGGIGRDTLIGAGGPDRFDFNATIESAVGLANRDAITGFSHAQHDRIDLATIDANQTAGHGGNQAFVFIGSQSFAAHAGSGEVRNGPGGVIQINVDADSAPEMEISVGHALVAGDFIL